MATLIIALDVVGVRAAAGPLTAGAVAFDAKAKEPTYEIPDRRGIKRRYPLSEARKIPLEYLPLVAQHLRKTAVAAVHVHRRPDQNDETPKASSWVAMSLAAARTAERIKHTGDSRWRVGLKEIELYLPSGGWCASQFVGQVGQRPAANAWQRAAAFILARVAHLEAIKHLHDEYPEYDFVTNLGNMTEAHRKAIKKYGSSDAHRGP